jgi:hypothetical protein
VKGIFIAAFLASVAIVAHGQVIAPAGDGFAVADQNRLRLYASDAVRVVWTAQSVEHPSKIIGGGNKFAVLDSFGDRIAVVRDGSTRFFDTGTTPVDAVFSGEDVVVLSRDARLLERIATNGDRTVLRLGADPTFLREANGSLYIYSRVEGHVVEVSVRDFAIKRRAFIAPFASDFETDGKNGYLLFPREAKLRSFPLSTLQIASETAAGAVPSDLALVRSGSALSATRLVIADPAAKRVWMTEGLQSVGGAFGRGFLRGLLGLGLFSSSQSQFPSGVDRVSAAGANVLAFDSATGTLYRVKGSKSETIAKGIAATGFTLTESGIAILENGLIRLIR